MQTATIAKPVENGRHHESKECTSTRVLVAPLPPGSDDSPLRQLATLRTYMAKRSDGAGRVYASIWVHAPGVHCSGAGHASGYGYHKASAAAAAAIESAGIELSDPIDGRGDAMIDDALRAIGRALGYSNLHVVQGL